MKTAAAFLKPAKHRQNLKIEIEALVKKIIFHGRKVMELNLQKWSVTYGFW